MTQHLKPLFDALYGVVRCFQPEFFLTQYLSFASSQPACSIAELSDVSDVPYPLGLKYHVFRS